MCISFHRKNLNGRSAFGKTLLYLWPLYLQFLTQDFECMLVVLLRWTSQEDFTYLTITSFTQAYGGDFKMDFSRKVSLSASEVRLLFQLQNTLVGCAHSGGKRTKLNRHFRLPKCLNWTTSWRKRSTSQTNSSGCRRSHSWTATVRTLRAMVAAVAVFAAVVAVDLTSRSLFTCAHNSLSLDIPFCVTYESRF